ncbi:hypothetical protein T484DRAFT_1767776, partial [Baffinella frigidus]
MSFYSVRTDSLVWRSAVRGLTEPGVAPLGSVSSKLILQGSGGFLETFAEEQPPVQLQLLTSIVKCFLKRPAVAQLQLLTSIVKCFLKCPAVAQDIVKRVLALVTQNTDNPDLRDRGYMYWRLLSTDPEGAK